ncbi:MULTISPECIES: hypothetical protein [unclassified Okeania]|uniref:hypothetical protein n=1 Tax=unclassified Okeania TaxID=2634635 RepID=UPI0013C04516|nr:MULTISPECIES: hypothetical protein [unclassified Okeania]NEQ75064.1 hypothetical protein [Okeania sp. SIO2C9]NET42817.1 hypothetical protein [Okeania sp. SIO2B3]
MPSSSTGPQKISINPSGKLVTVAAFAQSSANQTVTIVDSNGNEVFSASGSSRSGGVFTYIGGGSFTSAGDGNYTVTLTEGSDILVGEDAIIEKGEVFLHRYSFITNDGGSNAKPDFNDLFVTLSVFGYTG